VRTLDWKVFWRWRLLCVCPTPATTAAQQLVCTMCGTAMPVHAFAHRLLRLAKALLALTRPPLPPLPVPTCGVAGAACWHSGPLLPLPLHHAR
jgi:hypothetical protein